MIYMEPHKLGWKPLMLSWLNTLPPSVSAEHKTLITELFDNILPICLELVHKALKVHMGTDCKHTMHRWRTCEQ